MLHHPFCGQIFEEFFLGTCVSYSFSCYLSGTWQSALLPSEMWLIYLTWLNPLNMREILLRLAQNCLLHPHSEKPPADGQLRANDTARCLALFHRTWGRDNVRAHGPCLSCLWRASWRERRSCWPLFAIRAAGSLFREPPLP